MTVSDRIVKRAFDLFFSFLGLLFLWPIIIGCVAVARRDTGLSGVFSQERVGRNGRVIRVRKIRSMRNVQGVKSTVTVSNDVRITESGKFMRRWKLDELPQLWNVITGDMSFVGPRPDVAGYADRLVGKERQVLDLKPGITGPATIKYREEELLLSVVDNPELYNDEVIYPDKVALNLAYLQDWTLWTDIKYIMMTVHLMSVPRDLTVSMSENSTKL